MAISTTLRQWAESLFAARNAPAPPAELFRPVAIDTLASLLWQLQEPDEILRKAGKDRRALRAVAADDEVAAAIETRLAALLSTPWRLEPGDDPVTEFVWNELENHAVQAMSSAFQALLYGYSVAEAVWMRRGDGRIVIERLEERPFEWFVPGRDGGLKLFAPGYPEGRLVDTESKFFLTRNQASWRNPKGDALLSRCYWPWFLRAAGWRFWARFLERSAAPILLGKSRNTDAMLAQLQLAVQSAVAAIDHDDNIESVGVGRAGEAFQHFTQEVNKRIQKAILGQTLTTDLTGGGSFAAAKVHESVRDDRRLADMRLVTGTMQRIVDALVRWNFPGSEPPRFVMEDSAGLETERAERDLKLAQTGQVRFTLDYWLNRYDFEPGEIELAGGVAPGGDLGLDFAALPAPENALQFARRGGHRTRRLADQAAVDALADRAIERAEDPVAGTAIRDAIAAARDREHLVELLGQLATGMPSREFGELVERALFAADIIGFASEDR